MTQMLIAAREHHFSARPSRRSGGRHVPCRGKALDLLSTVDAAVIPRLHAALQDDLRRPRHPLLSPTVSPQDEIADLADRMLAGDVDGACRGLDAMRLAGRSMESIYLATLAPAACHLRDLWSDDLCGFAEVTLALCNLQAVLRRYAADFCAEAMRPESGSRVLIVAPQDGGIDVLTPMFGLVLMSQFFRRDGWDATIERDFSGNSFRSTIGEWFDLVEVLAASDSQLDLIASGIRTIRRLSPNGSVGVVVCGQIFSDRPEYIGLVGADLAASDPLSSLSQAKLFVTSQAQRRRLS